MGYYEQIGEANRQYRARRAAMHPLRRRLVLSTIVIYCVSTALWIVLPSPLWLLALR